MAGTCPGNPDIGGLQLDLELPGSAGSKIGGEA